MHRWLRMSVGAVLLFSLTGRDARAQWGYGGWGWGGWGASSAVGDAAAGAGMYAMGAGVYNLNTAQARSINADTVMKFNDYVARSALESASMYEARKNKQIQHNKSMYNARQLKIRENPDRIDIERGDALNAAVDDLNNPKIGPSAVRAAKAPVPASLIAAVPFVYASERVTFIMDDLRSSVKWPEVFEDKRFADDEKAFDALRDRVRSESDEGEVKPKTLRDAKGFLNNLRARLEAQPLADPLDQKDALGFVTACESLLGLLEKPDIRPAITDLRKVTDTTVGNLLGFLHAYNLRFGAATTPKERQAYTQLFAILDQTRDQVLAAVQGGGSGEEKANPRQASEFFQSLSQARKQPGSPQPPPPGNAR
jgi:hypothetical protein